MKKKARRYSEEFSSQAVDLAKQPGSLSQEARQLVTPGSNGCTQENSNQGLDEPKEVL